MPDKKFLNSRIILISLPFLLALLVLVCVRMAVHNPGIVEEYYSRGVYPFMLNFISMMSGLINISLWDMFWMSMIILVITGLVLVLFRAIRLKFYLLRVVQMLLLFYSFFYILWGFNYFRPGIDTRMGWKKIKPDEQAFRLVLDSLINNSNKNYIKIATDDYAEIETLIEKSYHTNGFIIGIDYDGRNRKPKKMLLSSYFLKSGVSGYFGPLFNEVHVNPFQVPTEYPFILAHEKAHQFGIASEAEASLAGYIICAGSEDQRLRYSGNLYLLLYFLSDAKQLNDFRSYLKKIDRKVMDDIRYREKYYDKLTNKKLEKMQNAANDVYLRSNNINKGIHNYNQVVGLMINFYRQFNPDVTKQNETFAEVPENY